MKRKIILRNAIINGLVIKYKYDDWNRRLLKKDRLLISERLNSGSRRGILMSLDCNSREVMGSWRVMEDLK